MIPSSRCYSLFINSLLDFYVGPTAESRVMETLSFAHSTKDLMRLTGGRSVYSEKDLQDYDATMDNPVNVINYLPDGYVNPPTSLNLLQNKKI